MTEFTPRDVTCHTTGCANEGITLTVAVDAASPAVACGPCGQWIIPPEPDEPAGPDEPEET